MVLGWRSGGGLWWRPTRQGIASWRLIETMVRGAGFGRLPFRVGSIDLRMPEKTHPRSSRGCFGIGSLLELLRRQIAQCRVQPLAIVILLDELLDVGAQVVEIRVLVGIDLFPLERFHEALATGVV